MIYGGLLVIVIAFAPAGLVGTLINARERLARRLRVPRKQAAEAARG
jgi:hypothetical protein